VAYLLLFQNIERGFNGAPRMANQNGNAQRRARYCAEIDFFHLMAFSPTPLSTPGGDKYKKGKSGYRQSIRLSGLPKSKDISLVTITAECAHEEWN